MILNVVKEKREGASLTVGELAEKTGMTSANIYRIENGGSTILSTAKKISKALKCSIDELRGE